MKEAFTLRDVAIGQLCQIKGAGGKWRVIGIASDKVIVQNTKSNQEMTLKDTTEVIKIY